MKRSHRLAALLLAVCVCCCGCGGKTEDGRATTMRLEKAEGEVLVWDEQEENLELQENLPLYSGYSVLTQEESYGWIGLDDTKLAKLGERGYATVQKEGRDLLLTLEVGDLFFQVAKPLEEDETMEIRTSSMVVGIRGTCGWTEGPASVYILEGTVTCEFPAEGLSAQVSAGERAFLVPGDDERIEIVPFTQADIPDFVRVELDDTLLQSVPEELPAENVDAPAPQEPKQEDNVYTLPMTGEEFRSLPRSNSDEPIIIRAGENDNTLVIDRFATVYGHVILEEGVTLILKEDTQMNIDGTLEVHSDVVNDGFIWVQEEGTLQIDGTLTNTGMLSNGEIEKGMDEGPMETQASRIIVAGGIESTGYLENVGTIEGTITINGGNISLMAGTVEKLILNDGLYIDDGGACGEFVHNGGKTTSAAQGYRY